MRPYGEEALEMKLRLLAGLVDVPEVVAWADEVFARSPEYDDDLANICLASKASWKPPPPGHRHPTPCDVVPTAR